METKDSEAYKAGDWIIKSHTSNGNIKEATFSGQEEARHTIKVLREFGMEGHFELVFRPRAEDVVVTSYRNEPEEEPLAKPEEESGGFDRERVYRDASGDIWTYLSGQSGRGPGWYFQEEEGGHSYGPFYVPVDGPHEEVPGEGAIIDPRDLLKSKQYLDSDGCVWEFRIHPGKEMPGWHYRLEGRRDWDPFRFRTPADGPWTEYKGQGDPIEIAGDDHASHRASCAEMDDDEPEFDTAYTYSDRHGDEWRYEEEEWWCYQQGYRTFRTTETPPAEYGPYTRIEE